MAKCNCMVKAGAEIEKRIIAALPEGATLRSHGWNQSSLTMGKNGVMTVGHFIEYGCKYQEVKKDGTPKARLSSHDHAVFFSFCPFCGLSLANDDPEIPYQLSVFVGCDNLAVKGDTMTYKEHNKRGGDLYLYDVFDGNDKALKGEITFTKDMLLRRIEAGHYVVEVQ